MGIGIEAWRQRIGSFSQYGVLSRCSVCLTGLACHSRVTPRWACVIAIMLVIGGIELNPGPPNTKLDDIIWRLDTITTSLDDAVRDFTLRFTHFENKMAAYATRLDSVEQAQAAIVAQFATLQAKVTANSTADFTACLDVVERAHADTNAKLTALQAAPPIITAAKDAPAAPVPSSLLVLNDVVRDLDLRAAKKGNLVISGLRPSSARDDTVAVADILRTELNITANVTHCVRLGKPTDDNHPRRLLVTLSSDSDSSSAIRSAKKLRSSTDAHVRDNVYINADLTLSSASWTTTCVANSSVVAQQENSISSFAMVLCRSRSPVKLVLLHLRALQSQPLLLLLLQSHLFRLLLSSLPDCLNMSLDLLTMNCNLLC
jgi:hypothetical protein